MSLTKEEKLILERFVARGVALLNERLPNWKTKLRKEIALHPLEIESCENCVLGMLMGDYRIGIVKLGVINGGVSYGFAPSLALVGADYLEKLWMRELKENEHASDTKG